MSKIGLIVSLFFISTGMFLFSQEDNNWVQGKTIVDVEFEGLNNIDKNELNGVVSKYIGQEFSDELFLELQTLMYELDYFEIIVPSAKPGDENNNSVVIVFQVQESPSISKITFTGNSLGKTELFGSIMIKAKDIYSDFKVKRAQDSIIKLYNGKGYPNVSVEVEKESIPEDNSLLITFNINEGDQTLIKEINFHGNNIFTTDSKLRSLIDTKKKSLFKDGVYKEDVIQSDILKIEGLYHNNGYIKARVVDVKTTLKDDESKENVKNMTIDFFIEEGDVYTYGGITYKGNEIYTDAQFDKFEFLKYGEVYNKSLHERRFVNIQSLYYDNGYIENSFHDEVEIDEENKIISHVITIVERGVAHIGTISVTGNTKTKDIVILREIQIESGDVFSRQKVWEAMSNIMSTAIFTNTIPQLNKNESGNMDLVFEVEEARTLNLMGGITVSGADFEPALSFSLKDTNFMGMGRTFGGSLNLGVDTQSFSLEYSEPRILNSEFFGGGSLSFSHSKSDILQLGGTDDGLDGEGNDGKEYPLLSGVDSYADYDKWISDGSSISSSEPDLTTYDISLALSGGHLWYTDLGRLRASAGFTSSMDTLFYDENITPFNSIYRDRTVGEWVFSDRVWTRFILDARDTPIGTTTGYGFSQNISIGGILPFKRESDYIKSISNVDFYFKLLDTPVNEAWNLVLSLNLHAAYTRIFNKPGMALPEGDKTAMIDGMFVGRGWQQERDGTALLDLKMELNVPIVPGMFGASLFVEGANLWNGDENESDFNIDDFKFSIGGSLGITNQIMPISFYMAKTFYTDSGSIVWSPESDYNKVFGGFATWGISFNMNYLLQ
ncbi:outer membrane protein assembly factor BamA [Thiospirochaeta perfilievii]|uniref:Outer membrane protein assembly factor BamA n=1 Tax=Thiospirochaeta perfilievii TaxID=252967 RepID=A0A5C1Q7B6_9SPIO|nr:outer membrane protein assembly factor BamA [Thiospirochaeta perfilievii]QEN03267.1 outer membrane protein assembly factor BamA [Thiospirochaeta perfilievii]